jgi:hypothetical protein
MSETDPDGNDPAAAPPVLVAELERVAAEVAAVREELRDLQARQVESVRTRSLVVVDADGFERVVIAGRGRHGHLTMNARAPEGRSVCAELFANDPAEGAGAHVGVALSVAGDVVSAFEVMQGRRPSMWVESTGHPGRGPADQASGN